MVLTPILLALAQSVLFGFSKIVYRRGMMNMPTSLAVLYTLLPAPILLGLASVVWGEFRWLTLNWESVVLTALSGLLNFNLGRLFLFESIRSLGAARASQLITFQLITASLFGVVFLGEAMTVSIAGGSAVIFVAISFLILSPPDLRLKPFGYNLRRGVTMGLIGSTVWGSSFLVSRWLVDRYPPVSASLLTYVGAIGIQALMSLPDLRRLKRSALDRRGIGYLLGSGVVTTVALLSFMTALQLAPIVIVAPFASLSPIFAALSSYLFIQRLEFVGVRLIVASLLVAVGSYIITI